jgi:hypothetical protein
MVSSDAKYINNDDKKVNNKIENEIFSSNEQGDNHPDSVQMFSE